VKETLNAIERALLRIEQLQAPEARLQALKALADLQHTIIGGARSLPLRRTPLPWNVLEVRDRVAYTLPELRTTEEKAEAMAALLDAADPGTTLAAWRGRWITPEGPQEVPDRAPPEFEKEPFPRRNIETATTPTSGRNELEP
jgi:hypothetical protein